MIPRANQWEAATSKRRGKISQEKGLGRRSVSRRKRDKKYFRNVKWEKDKPLSKRTMGQVVRKRGE